MTDDIVEQLSGEPSHPVFLVAQQGSGIVRSPHFITVITLHMHRGATEITRLDQTPHTQGGVAELMIVSRCELESFFGGEIDQSSGFFFIQSEWFLHINMASLFQTEPGNVEMALRRRRDVNYVRTRFLQHFVQIAKILLDWKPLRELARHQRLPIAHTYNLAVRDSPDLRGMRIGNLAAADDANFKHALSRASGFLLQRRLAGETQ